MGLLLCGADEAGRGPVLGPLVVACVTFKEEDLDFLEKEHITDSKKLTPHKRTELAEKIKEKCAEYNLIEILPSQIDQLHTFQSLNVTEVKAFAKVINGLKKKPDVIYLDAADVNEARFGQEIAKLLDFKPKEIISKHKGDSIYRIVGAASILAKTHRDLIIEIYKSKFGEIGSGYPSDPTTRKFIENYLLKHNKLPEIVRTSWKTVELIKKEAFAKKQKKLDEF